jgi:hypothetical protein
MCKRKVFLCLMLYLPLLSAKELGIKDLIKLPFAQVYNIRVKPANNQAVKKPLQKAVKLPKSKAAKKLKPVHK